jgi:high-affinity iron transporter
MLETLVIIFREGLEAFLIVAIMLAYLTKTGRFHLIKPVYAGVAAALFISATTGLHVAELAQDPIWEGTLAVIAGVLVASFTIYIMRTAKTIRQEIGTSLEKNAQKEGIWAEFGVFFFTILMVAREGMETALMLGAITAQNDATDMWIGAFGGLALIGIVAYLWSSQSQKINLRLFLQVTGIFLVLFSVHLFFYGLHELSEMEAIPLIGSEANMNFHIWTEPMEEDFGANLITLGLLFIPVGWLGLSFIKDRFLTPRMQAAE